MKRYTNSFAAERPGFPSSGAAALCVLVAVTLVLVAGCRDRDEAKHSAEHIVPARVHIATVTVKTRPATEDVVGTVRAQSRATIEAKVSGRITELAVDAGQQVKRGDLLLRLEAREIEAKLEQARALLKQAERDRKRFANLLARQAVTQRQYDEVEAHDQVAQAAVTEAETMFGYTTVNAPFDAVVTRKLANVGDLATPGKPLLMLETTTAMQVEAHVSEALIGRIHIGDTTSVDAKSLTQPISSTVSEIAPAADPASRTFLVKLDLPATDGLRSGQFVRVAVPVGSVTAPYVPEAAVVRRGELEMVFIVDDHTARMRLIKTGKRDNNEVEILAGLEGGETVVDDGAQTLDDGDLVVVPK